MSQDDNELSLQLGALSIVKSKELMENLVNTKDALQVQKTIQDAEDKVETTKEILEETQPRELTPELAKEVDKALNPFHFAIDDPEGVENNFVDGTETLGGTISPSDFIYSRLSGTESILSRLSDEFINLARRISDNFVDSRILFKSSIQASMESIDELEKKLKTHDLKSEDFKLSPRLFNLLRVGEKVMGCNGDRLEDYSKHLGELRKVSATISGLLNIYYKDNQSVQNEIFKYFGGFDKCKTDAEHYDRLRMMPIVFQGQHFKECTKKDIESTNTPFTSVNVSNELMGGRYLSSSLVDGEAFNRENIDTNGVNLSIIDTWTELYYKHSYLKLKQTERQYETTLTSRPLTYKDVSELFKVLRTMLTNWERVYAMGEKHEVSEKEIKSMLKFIEGLDVESYLSKAINSSFRTLLNRNQTNLAELRTIVTNYLVLLVNAHVSLINEAIEPNPRG